MFVEWRFSVTLSEDILAQVDQLVGSKQSPLAFIRRVLRRYLPEQTKNLEELEDQRVAARNAGGSRLGRLNRSGLRMKSFRPEG